MAKFLVSMVDCGTPLWEGNARDAFDACRLAAKHLGVVVDEFRPHDAESPSARDSCINRFEVSVYRWPGTEEGDFVGTFAALVNA